MNEPVHSKKVPAGCAWAMVAVAVVLLVMGVISLVAIPILWKRSQEVWTETQGTLVESYLKEGVRRSSARDAHNRRDHDTYDVRLKYRYQAGGRDYSGDEKALRQPEDDEDRSQAVAVQQGYKTGEAIAVYYKPEEPTKSRFTAKEPGIEFGKDLILMMVYLLGGWALFVWGRKLLR